MLLLKKYRTLFKMQFNKQNIKNPIKTYHFFRLLAAYVNTMLSMYYVSNYIFGQLNILLHYP